jgi:hypothetical protein
VEALLAKERKSQIAENWIGLVHTRLAAHREEKPTTKAAQIRALWPEIEAALQGGHSAKKICAWLEEEAGITVGVTSLTSYISGLRSQEHAGRRVEDPSLDSVPAETRPEPILAPSRRDRLWQVPHTQIVHLYRRKTRLLRPCGLYRHPHWIFAGSTTTAIQAAESLFERTTP